MLKPETNSCSNDFYTSNFYIKSALPAEGYNKREEN